MEGTLAMLFFVYLSNHWQKTGCGQLCKIHEISEAYNRKEAAKTGLASINCSIFVLPIEWFFYYNQPHVNDWE